MNEAGGNAHGENSTRSRIERFFAANPDEELLRSDLAAKFSVKPGTADQALEQLVKSGVLESVRVVRLRTKGIASKGEPA